MSEEHEESNVAMIFKIISLVFLVFFGGCVLSVAAETSGAMGMITAVFASPLLIVSLISFAIGTMLQNSHETAKNTKKALEQNVCKNGKKCPECAEIVKQEAKKCRFCGYNF